MDGANSESEEEDWTLPAVSGLQNQPMLEVSPRRQVIDLKKCENSHGRVIAHIDMDCFYAQVEMIRNPTLRNKPLGVKQKTIIVTCNYKARELGVTKMMYINEAREKCPQLVLVNGEDLTPYREMSYKISEFLLKYTSQVERHGFDENFLDLTEMVGDRMKQGNMNCDIAGHVYEGISSGTCGCGCHGRLTVGSQCVAEIREALYEHLGITCCGGIAHNKLASKLVAGTHKPNQQTTMFPEQTRHLMDSLNSVRNITGIGHATSKRLQELGITTVNDLQNADSSVLEREFGPVTMATMKRLCIGVDDIAVVPFGLPQSLSEEDSLLKCTTATDAKRKIKQLITSLLKRLLDDGRTPHTLRLTIRRMSPTSNGPGRESRQCPIPASVFNRFTADNVSAACGQLEILAMCLLRKMVDLNNSLHLSLANVAFTKMEQRAANSIVNFFSPKTVAKREHLVSSTSINADSTVKTSSNFNSASEAFSDADATNRASSRRGYTKNEQRASNPVINIFSPKSVEKDEHISSDSINNDSEWKVCTEFDSTCKGFYDMEATNQATNNTDDAKNQSLSIDSSKVLDDLSSEVNEEILSNDGVDNSKNTDANGTIDCSSAIQANKFKTKPPGLLKWLTKSPPSTVNTTNDTRSVSRVGHVCATEATDLPFFSAGKSSSTHKRKLNMFVESNLDTENPETTVECKSLPKRLRTVDVVPDAIPDGIDQAVFSELPADIQKEILIHSKVTTNTDMMITQKSCRAENQGRESVKTSNVNNRNECQAMLIITDQQNLDNKISGTVNKETTQLQFGGSDMKDESHSSLIPPNIDKAMFLSLPVDIQNELRNEWRTKSTAKPESPHFRMPGKCSAATGILSYFSKTNKK